MSTNSEKPLLTSGLPRTYAGLFDDSLIRYEGEFASNAFFNKLLAKHIFFGGYLYVNDGYLVNHPTMREHFMDDDSVLRQMLYYGFVRILSRNPASLPTMPEDMKEKGNRTFVELCRSEVWSRLRPTWELVTDYVVDAQQCHGWPKWDMSQGFVSLMTPIWTTPVSELGFSTIEDQELELIHNFFDNSGPLSGNARDKFEKAAAKVFGFDLEHPDKNSKEAFEKMRQVMRPANECYHNNIGMMQTVVEGARGFVVETTLSPASDDLHESNEIYLGQLDGIELLKLPRNFPYSASHIFLPFLDHTHRVGQAKLQYLNALSEVLRKAMTDWSHNAEADRRKDINEATKTYYSRIRDHVEKTFGRTYAQDAFEPTGDVQVLVAGGKGADTRHTHFLAGANAGIILALRDAADASGQGIDFITHKLSNVESVVDQFKPDPYVIKLGDLRPLMASLAFDKQRAANHVAPLKEF
jgi:hypothetical protein